MAQFERHTERRRRRLTYRNDEAAVNEDGPMLVTVLAQEALLTTITLRHTAGRDIQFAQMRVRLY